MKGKLESMRELNFASTHIIRFRKPPVEFAVEAQKLPGVSLEGSVG
jgi:hypothetical protein